MYAITDILVHSTCWELLGLLRFVAMVLHRLTPSKAEKLNNEKIVKKKSREIKESQEPTTNHKKEDLKKGALHVCKTVCKSMGEDTRQQARVANFHISFCLKHIQP